MALPATDSFTDTDGVQLTTHSSNWSLVRGEFDIYSNKLRADDTNASFSAARWNADTFDNNQYSQISLTDDATGGHQIGVSARCSSTAVTFYTFTSSGQTGYFALLRVIVDSSQTNLASGTNITATSVMRITADGSTITCYDDGAQNIQVTDSSIASGYAGVSHYTSGTAGRPLVDNWEGGNLTTVALGTLSSTLAAYTLSATGTVPKIYYVDYKNGLDSNTGGTSDPLKTLAHTLASHASNGDTIKLRGSSSDYETFYHDRGISTSLTNLTITNDTGHTPVIVGSTVFTSWSKTGGRTNVYEATYTPETCYFVWNGSAMLTSVADVATCDSTTNSRYFDNAGDKLYVNIGGSSPTSIEVIDTNVYGLTISAATFTISNIYFQYWFQAELCVAAAGTIDTCTFRYHPDWGGDAFSQLRITASTVTIDGCSFSGLGKTDSSGPRSISIASTVSDVTITDSSFTGSAFGVYLTGGTGHVIDNCTFHENQDGITSYSATATVGLIVRNCTLSDCEHSCIALGYTSNATLHHNTIYATATLANGYGIVLHNNGNTSVYHNILYALDYGTSGATGVHLAPLSGTLYPLIKNNIFYHNYNGIAEVSGTVSYAAGALDYNCFYGCTNNYSSIDAGDQGANDITSDPSFVNAPTDFSLNSSSPCINEGVVISGINDGYSGAAPDIGRYEYTSSIDSNNYAINWGVQSPTSGTPLAWSTWDDGAGGSPNILGDTSWGTLQVYSPGTAHSGVIDIGTVDERSYTLQSNAYGTGFGSGTLQIRGGTAVFTQDAASPSWTNYSGATVATWRYIQVREVKA